MGRPAWTIQSVLAAVEAQAVPDGECLVLPGWRTKPTGRPMLQSRGIGRLLGMKSNMKVDVARVVKYASDGPAPEGKEYAVNTCGNKRCVRLEHIEYSSFGRGLEKTVAEVLQDVVQDAKNANGCLVLEGYQTFSTGYPAVRSVGVAKQLGSTSNGVTVARVVMYAKEGRPEPGQHVRHLCGNVLCVNADHLTYGTRSDNMRDMEVHGDGKAKVSDEDEARIRELVAHGLSQREVSARFGRHRATVNRIINRLRAKDKPRALGTTLPFLPTRNAGD